MVLGYIGYHQLSGYIGNVVYGQLDRSAAATAARVDREFSIRKTVLIQTGNDVLAIQKQYSSRQATLSKQRDECMVAALVSSANAIASPSCKPFLADFVTIPASDDRNTHDYIDAYKTALDQGLANLLRQSKQEEKARMVERLKTFRTYFPETEPIAVFAHDQGKVAQLTSTKFPLPPQFDGGPGIIDNPLSTVRSSDGHLYLSSAYPLDKSQDSIVAIYDISSPKFLINIKDSGPHIDKGDQIWVADQQGHIVYPAVTLPDHAELIARINEVAGGAKGSTRIVNYNWPNGSRNIMVASTTPIADMGWVVVTATPQAAVASKLKSTQNIALAAIIGTIVVSALVGLAFVTSATRAIGRLTDGALVFARRQFGRKIDLKTGDELETLAETMNNMAAQIEAAEKQLDEKNKEFINIATHELKAPMTAIIGYLSMVVEDGVGKIDDKAREMINQAFQSTTRLRDLVTELLDIARLEAGKAQFDIKPLDLKEEAGIAVKNMEITAKDKNIKIIYKPPAELPPVAADKTKLGIIVTNFISNAIKYNRENGSVTVAHQLKGEFVVTSVADTGLGIPADQQDKMFQKFFRVSGGNRSGIPGTGLGLHITKQFIEAMGGKVWFESTEGKGTTFFFTLPTAHKAIAPPAERAGAHAPAESIKVKS